MSRKMSNATVLQILLTAAALLAAIAAPAAAAEMGKGIRLGIASSKLTNDSPAGDSGRLAGLVAGAFISYELVPGVAIAPELLYAHKGGSYDLLLTNEGGAPIGTAKLHYNLHYLEVPVLARISVPLIKAVVPGIVIGPRVSWKVDSSADLTGSEVDGGVQNPDWEDTDYGMIVGLSFQLGLGPASASLDLRADWGLSNLNKEGPAEIKNRSLMALAGIQF